MGQPKLDSLQEQKELVSQALRKKLAKQNASFVLITCQHPDQKGSMQVEMIYEGDPCLVAMLIENAQGYLQDETIDAHVN
jgi:hypothetical protein